MSLTYPLADIRFSFNPKGLRVTGKTWPFPRLLEIPNLRLHRIDLIRKKLNDLTPKMLDGSDAVSPKRPKNLRLGGTVPLRNGTGLIPGC